MTGGRTTGYVAGIVAGVSYGLNPLFGKSLLEGGVPVYSILFFRYLYALILMGAYFYLFRRSLKITLRQVPVLILLGLFFAGSSIGLFEAFSHIPAGLATTLVYLYPLFTAIAMVILGKSPNLKVWLAMVATIAGVVLLCLPSGNIILNWKGMFLASFSALSYAMYLVIVNNNKTISDLSAPTLTFYALAVGAVLFALITAFRGDSLTEGIDSALDWANLLGLAVICTAVAMLSIAVSTRFIGPTKTAVLGVFEPITAILIGCLAFGEVLTPTMWAGIAICVAAVTFMIAAGRGASK